jgi:hypothetical protein
LLPAGEAAMAHGREVLRSLDLVRVNSRVLEAAGSRLPAEVRSRSCRHVGEVETEVHHRAHHGDHRVGIHLLTAVLEPRAILAPIAPKPI